MKKITFIIFITLFSCTQQSESDRNNNLVEKRIKQKIEADGLGMIKINTFSLDKKINDSVFQATHSFNNPMIEKEMNIVKHYTFNTSLDSIVSDEDISTQMMSEGEWVDFGW